LAENWEIVIFFIGVILLIVEIAIIPGFGFVGIAGLLLIVSSLILVGLNNTVFDFTMPDNSIKKVYVQPINCTIELKWKEILVLFDIEACNTPFKTGKQ